MDWREGGLPGCEWGGFLRFENFSEGFRRSPVFSGLYIAEDDAGSAPASEVGAQPLLVTWNTASFGKRCVWFLLTRSRQILPDFIKTSVLGLCSCRTWKDNNWLINTPRRSHIKWLLMAFFCHLKSKRLLWSNSLSCTVLVWYYQILYQCELWYLSFYIFKHEINTLLK